MNKSKNNQRGLFDEQFRLEALSKQNDPLEKLLAMIPWNVFKKTLKSIFKKERKTTSGRPPYKYVMMFKILILQRLYNLSDNQMQFQIMDRLSFMRFLDLGLKDRIPDEKTIWLFRDTLTKSKKIETLFNDFNATLYEGGLIAKSGNMIDASFIEAPKQRNSREENKKVKKGETPEDWKENPNKLCQKDLDARWTKKNNETHFGYKNHVKVDKDSKLIKKYVVTSASVHDSQPLEELVDEDDSKQKLYADSAYSGQPIKDVLKDLKIKNMIHEKGARNNPLTEKQKKKNKKKSKIRARVEHVFAFMEMSMNGMTIRSIGLKRANGIIGLMNIAYNMRRFVSLQNA